MPQQRGPFHAAPVAPAGGHERMDERISVREPPRLIEGCGDTGMGLVQPTERGERSCEIAHHVDPKIVDGETRIERAIGRVEVMEAALQMGGGGGEVTERESRNAEE